jgi:hypothetical protein
MLERPYERARREAARRDLSWWAGLLIVGALFGGMLGYHMPDESGWWLLRPDMAGGVLLLGLFVYMFVFVLKASRTRYGAMTILGGLESEAGGRRAGHGFLGCLLGVPLCMALLQALSLPTPCRLSQLVAGGVGVLVGLLTFSLWPACVVAWRRRHERQRLGYERQRLAFEEAFRDEVGLVAMLRQALQHEQQGHPQEALTLYQRILEALEPKAWRPGIAPEFQQRLRRRIEELEKAGTDGNASLLRACEATGRPL